MILRPSSMRGSVFSNARQAAFSPAESPSKQNINSETCLNILIKCCEFVAVPSVATAFFIPIWDKAMTSMYPSTRIILSNFSPHFFNSYRPYNSELFRNTGVSGEFKYLGFSSPRTRPPKATVLPLVSRIGNIIRSRKRS